MRPEVPSILIGLGPFGARVVERVLSESRLEESDAGDEPLLAPIVVPRAIRADAVAKSALTEAKALLAHPRMVRARDRSSAEGLTRLHVFVVAGLGDAEVRSQLAETLRAIEARLLGELGPIFERYRTGAMRNLVLLPICAMPHPAAFEKGDEITARVRELADGLAARPARDRAVPQIFLIEDVAEFSVLSEAELEQCCRNFLFLLLYSLSSVSRVVELLYGRSGDEPLATFACATAEIPREMLRVYGRDAIALETVDAVLRESGRGAELADIDALEDVELAAFDEPRDADADILELLGRYAPEVPRDEEPPFSARAETLRDRYGPDLGDPSITASQPPADPPVGWALARMREIERSWRLLQRRRFDDLIARERERIATDRDRVLASIKKKVDDALFHDPAPVAFRTAATLVEGMERAVSIRLEDAIRDRDAALPVPAPSFESFKDAHASFLDEARRKPDLARMGLYYVLFVVLCTLFLPMTLRAIAEVFSIDPSQWQSPWLRERAWITALITSALGAGTYLFLHVRRAVLDVRRAFHTMFDALENTVTGARDSVLEYFSSRLRLAREVARVEALLAVRSAVLGDAERLTLLDRAARGARSRLLEALRAARVERRSDGALDPSRLFGQGDEALVESMLPDDSDRFLAPYLSVEGRDARVRDVLFAMARDQRYRHRWREEVPFTSIAALREAAMEHAEQVGEWDPLEAPESAASACRGLAAFARRQARSLRVALNLSGHELHDPSGVVTPLDGELIAPPRAYDEVRRLLGEEGAAGRARIPVSRGVDPDRAYYVVAIGDIHQAAVASLRPPDDDPRFEVEKD
ncbi:MAG: hypothetical protein AB7S26_27800 [Sandaracinaceae bacterium]